MKKRISTFLKFGHFLNVSSSFEFPFETIDRSRYENWSRDDLANEGMKIITDSICSSYSSKRHNIVPISGGLDSRAILSCLLKCCSARDITTYTFGIPGSLDYEIGNRLAKKLGTNHLSTNLNKFNYNLDYLKEIARNTNYQVVLFNNSPLDILKNNTDGTSVIWSGFLGGEIAGSHYEPNIYNHEQAKGRYIDRFAYHKNSFPEGDDKFFYDRLVLDKEYDPKMITLFEQYDFQVRQSKYIRPNVVIKDFNYILPFTHEKVFSFFMSIPNKYKINKNLFKQILSDMDSNLFSIGTKESWGIDNDINKTALLRKNIKLHLNYLKYGSRSGYRKLMKANYLYFPDAVREKKDINTIIYESIMRLDKRDIFKKGFIDKTYRNHMNKVTDNSSLLILLSSLEIIIQNTNEELYEY